MTDDIRKEVMTQAAGAASLQIAFIGVSSGLLVKLAALEKATPEELAKAAQLDRGYVERWCDAAYAFDYLDDEDGAFTLTDRGKRFCPDAPGTLMPFAVQSALVAHMADRVTGLIHTGERPGEQVLAEKESILPWFGPMLESTFGPLFNEQIAPALPVYAEADRRRGLVVDLGSGNGWYLRHLAKRYLNLRGIGLDGFPENVEQARRLAERDGVADRLTFYAGDINHFSVEEPAQVIAMNRALHHVWATRDRVFRILRDHLAPGGSAVIWEPRWPDTRAELRDPSRRGMALQNLNEHVQGNHFLRPDEIAAEFVKLGLRAEPYTFAHGNEMVVVGTRPE